MRSFRFEKLDHDVKDLEIIRYVAPIVTAKLVGKDGQTLTDTSLTGKYLEEDEEKESKRIPPGEHSSNVAFFTMKDGRYRTIQVVPDREIRLTAHAKGFKSESRNFKLGEGKTEEVTFVLEPGTNPPSEKEPEQKPSK